MNLPSELAKCVPKTHRMTETEWRNLGIQMSQGWVHYLIHFPGNNYLFIINYLEYFSGKWFFKNID